MKPNKIFRSATFLMYFSLFFINPQYLSFLSLKINDTSYEGTKVTKMHSYCVLIHAF